MSNVRLKKFMAAFVIGAFAFSLPTSLSEGRIHDPKVKAISSSDLRHGTKAEMPTRPHTDYSKYNGYARYNNSKNYESNYPDIKTPSARTNSSSVDSFSVHNPSVSQTVSTADPSIFGTPMASQEQCVEYLLRNNPNPKLSVSPEEIVAYYYEEAGREGIRPDVAFAQALKETGFFRYGGDVVPEQNNFCGLGTTGGGVRGGYFPTAQLGVRAHIQHLLAYTSTRRPTMPLVDPRYDIVRNAYGSRTLNNWSDLNGRWAVPGYSYGQDIMRMFRAILNI